MDPKMEEVFKLSGFPTHNFVYPVEFDRLRVSLRTPGRGLVIEGPSGIGKTSAVTKAIGELGLTGKVRQLSARKRDEKAQIASLPTMKDAGMVIIDDFHRLDESVQEEIADFLKTLADEERTDVKLIIIGINKAGDSLVHFAPDLNNRIDTIRFEANPAEAVEELVLKGERALKISLNTRAAIVEESVGSFYLAQMLCHESCLAAGVLEAAETPRDVNVSLEVVRSRVMERQSRAFKETAMKFAAGKKLKSGGRAPYLYLLKWLSEAEEWSISLDQELSAHPEQRGSVGQVVEKLFLDNLFKSDPDFEKVLHYNPQTRVLSVEDPQFFFYLRNIAWNQFARKVGFVNIHFDTAYDFALSFAGADREIARKLCNLLEAEEFGVFFDENEQHRILARDVEEYLGPIYKSEADYVICLLGPDYPKRIWTKFESEQFRDRFGTDSVIPIWFTTAPAGMFDETRRVGGHTLDPNASIDTQLARLVAILKRKVTEDKVARLPAE